MKSSSSSKKGLLLGSLGLLWLVIVLVGYYYTHKPFTPDLVVGLLVASWRIVLVFGLVSLSGGLGHSLLKGKADQPFSQTVLQAALGLGILSLVTLAIGSTLGFQLWLFALLIIALGVFLRINIRVWWVSWKALKDAWLDSGKFGKVIAVSAVFILFTTLLISLAPPIEFDALSYHLAIPHAYLQAGRISYLPDNMFWGMPEGMEMLNTLAMLFGGSEAALLLGWSIGLLTLLGIFSFTRERFGSDAGWVALACLLVGETFSASLAWGYVEWPSMLFATAMLIALDDWLGTSDRKSLILAGVFAGLCLSTKYTAGIMLLAGFAVIFRHSRSLKWKGTLSSLLLFGSSAVILFSPWLIKNFLATGNPLYPLLFPSGAMDQIRLDFYQKNSVPPGWLDGLLLPWQATIWGVEGKMGFSASIGPLFLGLSLLSGIGWKDRTDPEKRSILIVAVITVAGFLIWAIGSQFFGLLDQTRIFFSFFPAWAILAGVGFDAFGRLRAKGIRFGRIASALVLLVVIFTSFETGLRSLDQAAAKFIVGQRSELQYLSDHLSWYGSVMQSIRELPFGSKVLMLWETRSLYCLPKCDPDEVIDRWYHDIRVYGSADKVLAAWREQGYTHLLINLDGAKYIQETEPLFSGQDWAQLSALLSQLPTPVTFGESYSLYSLAR